MRRQQNLKYRNHQDLISIEGIEVDAGSLWVLKNGLLILEDEDQYASHLLTGEFVKSK